MAPITLVLVCVRQIMLIVDGRCRAGEVVGLVDLDIERGVTSWRMTSKFGWAKSSSTFPRAPVKIIDTEHFAALVQQNRAEMRAQEPCAIGN
jgi:hypothetical protein